MQVEEAVATSVLPLPMIPGNLESVSDKCFIGSHLTETVGWAG